MGPRKKSKPNPAVDENIDQPEQESSKQADITTLSTSDAQSATDVPVAPSLRAVGASQVSQSSPSLPHHGADVSAIQKQVENRASWYGSWKGKAKPVAEVAKDNIPASPASPALPSTSGAATGRRLSTATSGPAPSPRRYMSGSIRQQSKAAALPASTSNLSVVSSNTKDTVNEQPPAVPVAPPKDPTIEPPLPPDPATVAKQDADGSTTSKEQQGPASGWFGWWSRPNGYEEKTSTAEDKRIVEAVKVAQAQPLPESPAEERTQPKIDQSQIKPALPTPTSVNDVKKASSMISGTAKSSWFWLWSNQQNKQNEPPPTVNATEVLSSSDPTKHNNPAFNSNTDASKIITQEQGKARDKKETKSETSRKSASWAFWSRDEPATTDAGSVHKQIGEIAVADTPSQTHPEAAQFNEPSPPPTEEPKQGLLKIPRPRSLRGRGKDKDSPTSQPATPLKNTPSGSPERKSNEPSAAAVAGKSVKDQPKQTKEHHKDDKNLLLPDFDNTYSMLQQPSLWAQLRRMFISDPDNFPGPHIHLTPHPPRIKKALAIGVHGFFPSPIYQKILGQPTGTSIRFANCAAQAIKDYTAALDYECDIEKVALEGEGFVGGRVETLWKLLLNWIEQVRQADFILVACHSQGVPVAIQLVAKLVAFGCVSNARIGICAMAGVSLGPFAEYKTRIFGGSALELFDFAEPTSKVSETYRNAVEKVLKVGVKIVYVGSIDDQLVSLESSTFAPLSHPNVYRAVFIDGRLHTSDFLSQLIGFTLKLRNLGLPDHGLIRELSPALAGSLYTGEGHSSLHNYLPIYTLAVRHTLETIPASATPASNATIEVKWSTFLGPPNVKDANPFFLPWAMRGILEEEAVRKNLGSEVEELLRKFEEWKPVSKGLKDIRFRLEAVRSKL